MWGKAAVSYQCVRRETPTTVSHAKTRSGAASSRSELLEVAHIASRLSPYSGDPERFYLRREEVVERLRAIALTIESGR